MGLLRVAGASLYFEDAGGSGYPVVFLHPASGSSQSWQHQLPAFAANGFRCITYDLRNWGRSRGESTDNGCFSDDLVALIEHLGLERFALVGAAYGGFGAVDFAVRFPERLSALVLSGTQGGIADPVYAALRERVVSAPIRALPLDLRELGPSYRARDPEGVEAWLAIAGGASRSAPPALMRRIAEHLPDRQFVVLGESGHCLHWEESAEWNRLVLAFLQPLLG